MSSPNICAADPARPRYPSSACIVAKGETDKSVRLHHGIPREILEDPAIGTALASLPAHYNFEVHKCIHHVRSRGAKRVALQMPEGFLIFATRLADVLEQFTGAEMVILGDVTYGACCVDDFTARTLGCDFLIHYGHSCLVPLNVTSIPTVYVFVDIAVDREHIKALIRSNWEPGTRIAMMGIVQFVASIQCIKRELEGEYGILLPQARPLSPAEVLGCTSPKIEGAELILFVGDGRFHLESAMIANPGIPTYRYNPYLQRCTREEYHHETMYGRRKASIARAMSAKHWGLILGTIGRQGNPRILDDMIARLRERGKEYTVVLLSEIRPEKLALFRDVQAWVQVACPRLSIDWGEAFSLPLLTPYELNVALGVIEWQSVYPMDYYSKESLGPWTNRMSFH